MVERSGVVGAGAGERAGVVGAGGARSPLPVQLVHPVVCVLAPVREGGRVRDLVVEHLSDHGLPLVTSVLGPGAVPGDLIGRHVRDLGPDRQVVRWMQVLAAVADGEGPIASTQAPVAGRPGSGYRTYLHRTAEDRLVVAMLPLTEADHAQEVDEYAGPRWKRVFAESWLGLAVSSWTGVVLDANPALGRLLGVDVVDLVGHSFTEFSHPEDHLLRVDRERLARDGRVELRKRYLRADGHTVWLRLIVTIVVERGERRTLTLVEDVTGGVQTQAQLSRAAFTDPLTGLANRAALRRDTRRALRRWREGGAPAPALLLLGLDRFRVVNDALGHDGGDRLLRRAASAVRDAVAAASPTAVLARPGGDEFAVLVVDGTCAAALYERVQAALGEVCDSSVQGVPLSASAGTAVADEALHAHEGLEGDDEPDDGGLLRDADAALRVAKRSGGGRCVVADAGLRARAARRLEVEAQLTAGLERGELVAHFQPVTEHDGSVRGAEALVRWQHPEQGLLAPGAFLDVAEESDLVVRIGQVVLRQACREAVAWRRRRPRFVLSVNAAARHLMSGHLVDDVVAALDESGLPANALAVEITETALLVHDEVVTAALITLRAMGCHLSLDDFGTGYSSLAHLRDFPVDILKVDRSFTAAAPTSTDAARLLQGICLLGRGLGLHVVAEGVEDATVLAAAVAAGASSLQGYLLGRPAPGSCLTATLDAEDAAGAPVLLGRPSA